jgi:hypothetical protein
MDEVSTIALGAIEDQQHSVPDPLREEVRVFRNIANNGIPVSSR